MARISTYGIDAKPELGDKVIGTDANPTAALATKNYSIADIAAVINHTNSLAVADQVIFLFQNNLAGGRDSGTISFDAGGGIGTSFASITSIVVSKQAAGGKDITSYLPLFLNKDIILANSTNINNFGTYKVTGITTHPTEAAFWVVTLENYYANGSIAENGYYIFSEFSNPASLDKYVEGTGTTNVLPIWTDGPNGVLGDSQITQTKVDGGTIFNLNAITTTAYTPAINTKLLDLNSSGNQKFSITQDSGGGVVLPNNGGITNPGPSFNMGGNAFSNGENAISVGAATTAFGSGSLAANFITLASGGGASAFGLLTEAAGLASASFGNKSKATGAYSIASGQDSIASGQSAVAIGEKGDANGKNSFVQGFGGTAAGNNSAKFGYDGSAGGNNAVKFGFESIASGNASFASGWQTTASGTYSFTAGDNNIASGQRTVAFGVDNNVSGKGSFAIGARNTVPSENSFVGGADNILTGASGGVPGSQTSFVFGRNNTLDGPYSFVVGESNLANGSTSANPQNNLILIGNQNQAVTSNESIAIGRSNQNLGSGYSALIGRDNINTLGSNNYIFGRINSIYECSNSTIIGTSNQVSATAGTTNITLLGTGLKYNYNTNTGYGRATYVGYYNDELDPFAQFQIGNGTPSVRKNALSINKESEIKISEYGSGNVTGTATYNLAVDASGKIIETSAAGAPDYLSFVCLLSQSGAANPQPNIVLENSLGVVSPYTAFTRISSGEYNLNAPGKFKLLKTIVFLNGGSAENNHDVAWEVLDADNLRIRTHNSDGKLTKASLEIRTYN